MINHSIKEFRGEINSLLHSPEYEKGGFFRYLRVVYANVFVIEDNKHSLFYLMTNLGYSDPLPYGGYTTRVGEFFSFLDIVALGALAQHKFMLIHGQFPPSKLDLFEQKVDYFLSLDTTTFSRRRLAQKWKDEMIFSVKGYIGFLS